MAFPPLPDPRTAEEKAADHQRWIDKHYLEEGRRYTFELNKTWYDGYGFDRVETWTAYIKEGDCPWGIVASQGFNFTRAMPGAGGIAKARAERWARDYLKRGGPPEGFFDPPPPDPNMITYRKEHS